MKRKAPRPPRSSERRLRIKLNREIVTRRITDIPEIVRMYRASGLRHPCDDQVSR